MRKLIISNFFQNKKTSFVFLFSIVLSSMLIFLITLLFSAAHKYILNEVIENKGDYHVKIKTDLENYENFSVINHIKWEDDYVLISYNNIYDVYKLTNNLCKKTKCTDISYNEAYLSLYGISKDENLLGALKTLIIVVLIIVLTASSLIIYNIYKILLFTRYHYIAILQSIGLTLRNLRNMLLIEALIFSVLGIIIGFILSLLASLLIIFLINHLITIDLSFSLNIKFLFYAIVFLFLLIFFICLLPIIKAKKTSNLKLLKLNYKYKQNKKFKNIILALAQINCKRNKRHYKSVIISLVVFIVLTITFNMILNYSEDIINNYVKVPNYDVSVTTLENNLDNYKLLEEFAGKNATKYKIYETCQTTVNIEEENYLNEGPDQVTLYVIKGDNYFINKSETIINENNKIYKENKSYFKDKITLNINNKDFNLNASQEVPFGFENILTKDNLLIGVDNVSDICESNLTLYMNSNDEIDKELKKLLDESVDLYYVNARQGKEFINSIILGIKFFLYSILLLSFLVGITTVISSTFLSIQYRKKEFGLLKSIGLTRKNFKEIIVLESLYIVLKAALWSLPFVLFINYIINSVINEVIDIETVSTIKPFLWCFLISMLMLRVVMRLCYKKLEKKSVLNLINTDNI